MRKGGEEDGGDVLARRRRRRIGEATDARKRERERMGRGMRRGRGIGGVGEITRRGDYAFDRGGRRGSI